MGNCSSANDSQRSNLDQVGAATLDADLRVKRSTSHLKFAEQEKAAREPKSTVIRRRKTIQPASELHNVKASAVMTVEVKEVPTSTSTTSTAGETPLPTRPRKRHGGATVAPAPITTLSSTASSSTTTIPAIVLTEEPLKQFKQRVSGGVAVASGSEQLPGETPKSPRALRAKVTLPEDDESETATATEGASNIASTSNEPPLNIDACIERLRKAGSDRANLKTICLSMDEIEAIVGQARAIVYYQPMLLRLTAPLKIVGDTHGQFQDLLRIFDRCGYPPDANYLFLGDYVDRGRQSLETILLLLCYKIKYPENFFLLRGNHECASVNRVYGFFDECKRRCTIRTWRTFTDLFNCLPIAAVVENRIFCVHGGISPHLKSMRDIYSIKRPLDIPEEGLLNDLLWADPGDIDSMWAESDRGVSVLFGKKAVSKFLSTHNFELVARGHMVVEDGYEFFGDRQLVTLFSAPNYCGEFDNAAAVMNVSADMTCSFEIIKSAKLTAAVKSSA